MWGYFDLSPGGFLEAKQKMILVHMASARLDMSHMNSSQNKMICTLHDLVLLLLLPFLQHAAFPRASES